MVAPRFPRPRPRVRTAAVAAGGAKALAKRMRSLSRGAEGAVPSDPAAAGAEVVVTRM